MRRIKWLTWMLGAMLLLSLGCGCGSQETDDKVVRLAVTTSTANTGLLDYLQAEFLKDRGIRIDYIATGTGKALKHGRDGDVDAVLVHAPKAEEAFVADGYGVARVPVMWNDFVILGPPGDPARLGTCATAAEAMEALGTSGATFVSRGDDSGTHKKELAIWKATGIMPSGNWYVEAGQGMGACLAMANDKLGYVLTDRGTYLAMMDKLELTIAFEGDPLFVNPYAIIQVSPTQYPDLNHRGSETLIKWITSPRGQDLISAYRVKGEQLFYLFEN